MAILATKLKDSKEVVEFFLKTKDRIQEGNIVKNPFYGDVHRTKLKDLSLYIVKIEPIYFPFPVLLLVPAFVIFVLWGWSWFVIIPLFMSCLSFFWTSFFFKLMLKKGLQKAGVKQKIIFLEHTDIINEVVFNVSKRCDSLAREPTRKE